MTAPLDPSSLRDVAEQSDYSLISIAEQWGYTPGEQAAAILDLSPAGLLEVITSGDLSAIVVGGKVWVVPAQLQLRVLADVAAGASRTVELQALARLALRHYLAERPLIDEWDLARGEHRPLVCARRGSNWVNFGLEYHSVVMSASWLAAWSTEPSVRERWPELAGLPVGDVLVRALTGLPGVSSVRYARPLDPTASTHRVNGWIKVDPRTWDMNVPSYIAEAVRNPHALQAEDYTR